MRQGKRCGLAAMAEPLPRVWWTTSDVATFLGIAPSTIGACVARGQDARSRQQAACRDDLWVEVSAGMVTQ